MNRQFFLLKCTTLAVWSEKKSKNGCLSSGILFRIKTTLITN